MLIGLLSSLTSFVKVRYVQDKAVIDNAIFRLHYRFTSVFFFGACIVISIFDLLGKPIHCTLNSVVDPNVLNTFCWINGTYSLIDAKSPDKHCLLNGQLYPGLGAEEEWTQRRLHSYYQWVPFVLFLQGILFHLPHRLWKQHEHGKIRHLTAGIRGHIVGDSETRKSQCETLSHHLQPTLNSHLRFALAHITCETLNFVNAIANIYLIDRFLNGLFLGYGTKVIQYFKNENSLCNPMIEVFPRMAACDYKQGGPSGGADFISAQCLLPLNNVHDKIYIFLWFWLIILSVVSGLALVYRIVTLLLPVARTFILRLRPNAMTSATEKTLCSLSFGDYFLLSLLAKNIEGFLFNDLLEDLSTRRHHKGKLTDEEDGNLRPNVVYAPMTTFTTKASID